MSSTTGIRARSRSRTLAPVGLLGGLGVLLLAAALALVTPGSAAGHGGAHVATAPQPTRGDVKLRDCWLSVTLAPASPEALQSAFGSPLALSQTFYGADPLAGIWGLECDRARFEGRRVDGVILSLVGVPTGLTAAGLPPLANNFAHALLRADTDSRALARTLRRAGLPGRLAPDARYRHSSRATVPATGKLVVPRRYRIDVSASDLDPTNPHDHVNSFSAVGLGGSSADLFADDAFDRFCFTALGGCEVFVRAHRRSPLRGLLGDGSTVPTAGFDHAPLERVDLLLD
jgi:hypothetical protein